MPVVGLEPTRPCGQQILSLSRLPFRHTGIGTSISNNIIITYFKIFVKCFSEIFLKILLHILSECVILLICYFKNKAAPERNVIP